MQIIKRKRNLTYAEKAILYEIVHSNENEQWSIGALLLLDELEEAQKRFETLPEPEKEQLRTYPIGKFLLEESK